MLFFFVLCSLFYLFFLSIRHRWIVQYFYLSSNPGSLNFSCIIGGNSYILKNVTYTFLKQNCPYFLCLSINHNNQVCKFRILAKDYCYTHIFKTLLFIVILPEDFTSILKLMFLTLSNIVFMYNVIF